MADVILALDQGTTSSRAILLGRRGEVLAKGQREFTQIYPRPGYVEHDPMELLSSQFQAAADALAAWGKGASGIAAIGVANQRETVIVWERATGRPVFHAIVWQCRRTAALCEELERRGLGPYVTDTTGLIIDAYFSGTKIKWILDNVPGARDRAQRGELLCGTVDTWLIWNLTRGAAHVTDYSNASRTMLFDIHKLAWDRKLCRELDIPMDMLPQALPSSHVYGAVAPGVPGLEQLAGVPIAGAAGDQQAALFGQACFEPGDVKCTYGTGCFLMMNTGEKPARSASRLLSTVAWGQGGRVEYALEGSVFNAGSVVKWLRDDLGLIRTSAECSELAASVPDANGMYFVPAFTGLGAPHWDMYARGVMTGMTRGVNKAHVARAVIEAIAYQVTDLALAMEADSGSRLRLLRADGGASASDVLMQFQADMLDCRVLRPRNVETTALGAALLAGLAAGVWKDRRETRELAGAGAVFAPPLEATDREQRYRTWLRAVQRALAWEQRK